jgi:SAM-dependent methyltransferase
MAIMTITKEESITENINAWNVYSDEYYKAAVFSEDLLHIGLGLKGIRPDKIYSGKGNLLDIGCGNGTNTFLLAKMSHGEVTGIDPAKNAIRDAKAKYSLYNLRFHALDFEMIPESAIFKDISFANVTFFGSLDYIELNDDFFHILNKVTVNDSKCFIAKFHPFWTTLFDGDVEHEKIKSYYQPGRKDKIIYGNRNKQTFTRFHYPLSHILYIFSDNGWRLDNLEEPAPDPGYSAFSYEGYNTDAIMMDRLSKIPMTIILEFTRIKA